MLLRVWQTEEHETTSPDTLYIVRNYVEKECISYRTRQSVLYQVGSEQLLSGNSEDDSEERRRRQRSKCYLIAAYPVYQCPYVWVSERVAVGVIMVIRRWMNKKAKMAEEEEEKDCLIGNQR